MWERVRPLVNVRTTSGLLGLGRKTQVEVTLPGEHDKAMARDGVEAKPPQYDKRFGEKAWWLVQMLGAVPPKTWSDAAGASPEDVLEAALKTEWKELLVEGWTVAAERASDPDWGEALLLRASPRVDAREGLVALLPTARREAVLLRFLARGFEVLDHQHPAMQILQQCRHPWSPELARAVLAAARERIARAASHDWTLHEQLLQWALYIPPVLADEAAEGWPSFEESRSYWPERINRMTSLLQFRREMLEEIQR
jgi:hypothetical protein